MASGLPLSSFPLLALLGSSHPAAMHLSGQCRPHPDCNIAVTPGPLGCDRSGQTEPIHRMTPVVGCTSSAGHNQLAGGTTGSRRSGTHPKRCSMTKAPRCAALHLAALGLQTGGSGAWIQAACPFAC